MGEDDPSSDEQAKARTRAAPRLAPPESVEDMLERLWSDSRPGVSDGKADLVGFAGGLDRDQSSGGSELDRVSEQVREHLNGSDLVAEDREVTFDLRGKRDTLLDRRRREEPDDLL